MVADDEIEDEGDELEEYDVRPALVGDGDIFFDDPIGLMEMTDSVALQVRDGCLFVLKKDTLKWINVEDALKTQRSTVAQFPKTKQ